MCFRVHATEHGTAFPMPSAYSLIVLSLENLARTRDIQNGFARPLVLLSVQAQHPLVCLMVRSEVHEVHVAISIGQQYVAEG